MVLKNLHIFYMRFWLVSILLLTVGICFSQNPFQFEQQNKKGDFYIYWGWNRTWFGNSDIRFFGADYDFTLTDVWAKDRPSKVSFKNYISVKNLTIPQFNLRLGYFINDRYSISIGTDHMKYIVVPYQLVKLNGYINKPETQFEGDYTNQNIFTHEGFLEFEHTDGLNYINADVRRFEAFATFGKLTLAHTVGLGAGLLLPKTNTVLFNQERYDEYHLSGYGFNGVLGLNATFFNFLFMQIEFKPGFINMSDIRTTQFESDKASQKFLFYQWNMAFGVNF